MLFRSAYIFFWILIQIVGAALDAEDLQQVSWSAHLGGALAGGTFGLLLHWGKRPHTGAAD